MVLVTLIGEKMAKKGVEFVYIGPLTECRDCKLKTVCFNLEVGRRYLVRDVRNVKHNCNLHEDGVRVVEVESLPDKVGILGRLAIDGSVITFEHQKCGNMACENYLYCVPRYIKKGEKIKIEKILSDIRCPMKHNLRLIEGTRIS